MLIYVIPFVLLLVVAIVLKKREAGKEADKAPKKTAARTKSKPTTSKQKAALKNESHVAEAPAANQKQVTQLSTELKKQIQRQLFTSNVPKSRNPQRIVYH